MYLGCDITFGNDCHTDAKVARFNSMCGARQHNLDRKIKQRTSLKFYAVILVLTVFYGFQDLVKTERDVSRIQASEMKFLRLVNCVFKKRIRDMDVNRELQTSSIAHKIEEYGKR